MRKWLSDTRIQSIAELAGTDFDTADDYIHADWPNQDEHIAWLQTASNTEIADWVRFGLGY